MPLNPRPAPDSAAARSVARRVRAAALLLALGAGSAGSAHAAQCTLQVPDLNLGTYSAQTVLDTTATGSVSVSCVKTLGDVLGLDLLLTYTLSLSGTDGAGTPRTLSGPSGSTLAYIVTTVPPAGTGRVWGTGAGVTEVMTGQSLLPAILSLLTAQPVTRVLPYQARLPAGQGVRAGTYTGTLTVTLSF